MSDAPASIRWPEKWSLYARLIRLDKPIGTLLLLWPTLWALWFAADGVPPLHILVIFALGTFLMRSAGCAINDWADRDFDRHVARTRDRPLTSGALGSREALGVAAVLTIAAGLLILPLNRLTWALSVVAVAVAASYPFFKRFFALPQAYLGIAFSFGIPMAFAAVRGDVPALAWALFVANVFWVVAYDTEYALVDLADDARLELRTSALTFGRAVNVAIATCYAAFFAIFAAIGANTGRGAWFYAALVLAGTLAARHLVWIRHREPAQCFRAFLDNHRIGSAVFLGCALDGFLR